MDDVVESVFHIEVPGAEVWRRCRLPGGDDADRCRLPAFPSFDGATGCAAVVLDCEPQRLLRCRKADMPCADTEIGVRVEPANASGWPTRVTVWQRGFDAAMPRDVLETHWRQIAADFRLYLEREVTVPGTVWGTDLGASVRATETGLEVTGVDRGGFAARCGMRVGDLLLTVGPIRVHDLAQLWTVLALLPREAPAALGWARGRARMQAAAAP